MMQRNDYKDDIQKIMNAIVKNYESRGLLNLDKNISEIGYFINGSPSVEFKNLKNDKFLQYKSFSHF